jgi:hypothetical protein
VGSGAATFHARIDGVDAATGAPVRASANAGARATAPPVAPPPTPSSPALTAAVFAEDDVHVGEMLAVTLSVANGTGAALQVTPSVTVGGSASVSLVASASPADVAAGQRTTFTWLYRASARGLATFALRATAQGGLQASANASTTVEPPEPWSSPAAPPPVVPGALTAVVLADDDADFGETFTVTLVATNGTDAALQVTPWLTMGAGSASVSSVAAPPPATVGAGRTGAFTWLYRGQAAGRATFVLRAAANGLEARSTATVEIEAPERETNR